MPLVHVCRASGGEFRAGRPGKCAACRGPDARRRAANVQRHVWDSPRWRRLRPVVRRVLGDRCVDCRRHASELRPKERIVVDHKRGLATILAEGGDPFAFDELELRCSTCSGRKDGGTMKKPSLSC